MERLRDKKIRKLLILHGKKVVSRFMTLYFMENDTGVARYAVYGSKRLGGAVQRNRVKRLFREILNLVKLRLRGCDLIIIPRTGVAGMQSDQVRPDVIRELLNNKILLAG